MERMIGRLRCGKIYAIFWRSRVVVTKVLRNLFCLSDCVDGVAGREYLGIMLIDNDFLTLMAGKLTLTLRKMDYLCHRNFRR